MLHAGGHIHFMVFRKHCISVSVVAHPSNANLFMHAGHWPVCSSWCGHLRVLAQQLAPVCPNHCTGYLEHQRMQSAGRGKTKDKDYTAWEVPTHHARPAAPACRTGRQQTDLTMPQCHICTHTSNNHLLSSDGVLWCGAVYGAAACGRPTCVACRVLVMMPDLCYST